MNKIDFVIPWVDSSDNNWLRKKNEYSNNLKIKRVDDSNERFRDYGTLKFVLRSIEKFAPWVNHVYLITDNQIPNWLSEKSKKISIVDHKDIIQNEYLPVFNSNLIEQNIVNIPGLANCFVVFNDDTIINKKVFPTDFFKNGLPCDFRIYKNLEPINDFDQIPFNNSRLINQWIGGKWPLTRAGMFSIKYGKQQVHNLFRLRSNRISGYVDPHIPISFTKGNFREALSLWKANFKQNMRHRFRSNEDISIWLIRYYQLEQGKFYPRRLSFGKFYELEDIENIERDIRKEEHALLCINDMETKDYFKLVSRLDDVLSEKFVNKSVFEL